MNDVERAPQPDSFEAFSYRGWSFLCTAVPDERGRFWSIVMCELTWPNGRPVVLAQPTPSHSQARALVRARSRAVEWVKTRTAAAPCPKCRIVKVAAPSSA
ncbi:hypothetical protein QTI66_16825 [Variovorax sp. J22R133]|uniref:hypothetical protein n=1 Tax=Variovorax brevis TaxID=3053503 RepID=UPI0025762287|nr:hypothetical protein [Variovorax sp. J22R133]MDM0113826.1 hypothetical protein [Variovorax sp. J22R133]